MSKIIAKGLIKEYNTVKAPLRVLKGVSLSVEQGEMLGIVGVSGAGKSTLLHILGGLDRPSSGSVLYGEDDIFSQNDSSLARFRNLKVGLVFQFHHLLPEFTALENVVMPALIARTPTNKAQKKGAELLEMVGLSERITHKPGELSGGEQQRVAIARALVNSPQVVLADEPTGNLDIKTGDMVFDILLNLRKDTGFTLVIITHNEGIARKMERVIHLEDGRIVDEKKNY